MSINEIKKFLNKANLDLDENIFQELENHKKNAVIDKNEQLANEIWCLQKIFNIQKLFLDMYDELKIAKYHEAWGTLARIDIELCFLNQNSNYKYNEFNLLFIGNAIKNYEKLFPYQYFLSRESIIKSEKCSICGKKILLRGGCDHVIGKLYMGEMCLHEVTDLEFIGFAIVKKPFDKYGTLLIPGKEYNYEMLEHLIDNLLSPFEPWYVEELQVKKKEFENISRNEQCPCGSGQKYKKCCIGTKEENMLHYRVAILGRNMKETKLYYTSTWKQ